MLIHLVMASQGGKSLHLEMEDLIPATLRVGYGTRLVAVSKQTKKRQGKYEPNTAKASKDWGTADQVRDELAAKGIVLKDSPDGTSWSKV